MSTRVPKGVRAALTVVAGVLLVLLGVGGTPGTVSAVTLDLGCVFEEGICVTDPDGSYGTVTFTDLGATVQIDIDLTGTQNKILKVVLNYDEEFPGTTLGVSVDGSSTTNFTVGGNAVDADGCGNCFDIEIPNTGNLGKIDTTTLVLSSTGGGLDISNFLIPDKTGQVFLAVHIGNLGPGTCEGTACTPGQTGEGSVWAGSRVPEPGTMLLLGSALAAVGAWIWRRSPSRR